MARWLAVAGRKGEDEKTMLLLLRFWRDQSGATALEYAFIGGLVTVGLISSFISIGSKVAGKFLPVDNALN
jgi:pilus assembly protein Flp/PilA